MGSQLDEVTAAPSERTIGGKRFVLRRMTLGQWGQLEGWIKDRVKAAAKEEMGLCGPDDQDIRKARLRELFADLKDLTLDSPTAQGALSTMAGAAKMLELSVVSIDGQDVSGSDVQELVDVGMAGELSQAVMEVSGMSENPPKTGTESESSPTG